MLAESGLALAEETAMDTSNLPEGLKTIIEIERAVSEAVAFDYAAALRSRAEQGSYLPPLRTIYAGRPGVAKNCAVEWQDAEGRWHELDASVPVADLGALWDELRWHAYIRSSERPHPDQEG